LKSLKWFFEKHRLSDIHQRIQRANVNLQTSIGTLNLLVNQSVPRNASLVGVVAMAFCQRRPWSLTVC
jgi:hypothetical protein